jgi:hypothetical protein
MQDLYEADVRRVAPLGCAPRVMCEGMRALNSKGRSSCADDANELIVGNKPCRV